MGKIKKNEKDWRRRKNEGGGGEEEGKKGRSCLPNLNVLDHVLYIMDFVLHPGSRGE